MIRLLVCVLAMAGLLSSVGVARADEQVEPKKAADDDTRVVPPDVKIVPRPLFFSDDDRFIRVPLTDKDGQPRGDVVVVKFDNDDAAVAKEAAEETAKKVKVVVERIADELSELPLIEMADAFIGSEVLKDIQITIKLPDGTTHTIGGDDLARRATAEGAEQRNVKNMLRRFRYEPGKIAGARGHKDLSVRLMQLEEQNRRMQAELDLMRRRMNELLMARGGPTDVRKAPVAIARRARDRAHAGGGMDARLSRIEQMLHTLVQRDMPGPRARDVAKKRAKASKARAESDMQRAKARWAKDKRAKAPEQIEKMLEHSRKRIEELLRKLEEHRDGTKSPK